MADSQPERYRLEGKISSKGSFGEVWLATDTLLDRPVAIKRPKVAHDPIRRERFLAEARMLARLNHPNITQIYDVLFDEGENRFYLVMEYVDGKDLSQIIRGGTPLPLDWVLDVAMGILQALSYAHGQGIVHRDVKPGNVMIADDVKLTDFGLANLKSILQRGTSLLAGTLGYIAPEQIEGRPTDGRADLYSLGIMLFEMISGGHLPFKYADEVEMLDAHLHAAPPPISQFAPRVPSALEQVIMRLLAKDPEDRYPSADAVMDVLDSIHIGPRLSNLPVSLTPFVGREAVLAEIKDRLQDPACRLLTLVGPGGSGKTRLALETAAAQLDNFAHGVYYVSLAPLQATEVIVPTVAEALGFSFYEGVPPRQQLLDYLRQKTMLIIMDSYEHLLDGVGLVTDILKVAPDVRILTTSRARLNVQGEHLFPVVGMDFPALTPGPPPEDGRGEPKDAALRQAQDIAQYSAVKLFLSSARRTQPGFEPTTDNLTDVVQICRLVEGMPLGIELAAGLVEMLTPAEIAAEISHSLDVLETELRDVPERQRSMRTVFDHSWNLLTEREQEVFQGLSVFRGGFTRQAAQQVTGASLRELMALVNKSLLHAASRGRYELHELLRGYAAERLDQVPSTSQAAHDRHCAYYAAALQEWDAGLKGVRQKTALSEMDAEIENARAAWNWATEQGQVERLDQAVGGLCRFYMWRGRYEEGEAACRKAAEKVEGTASGVELRVLAKILTWQSVFSQALGQIEMASQLVRQSLAFLERPELADHDTRPQKASALLQHGHILVMAGQWPQARESYQQALELAEQLGDRSAQAWCQTALGQLLGWKQGQYAEGSAWLNQARAGFEELGNEAGVAQVLKIGGTLAAIQGNLEEARALYDRSLAIRRELEDESGVADLLNNLALVARNLGEHQESQALNEQALEIRQKLGDKWAIAFSLNNLGQLLTDIGEYETARAHLEVAVDLQREIGDRFQLANALHTLANVIRDQGDYAAARPKYDESLAILWELGERWLLAYLLEDMGGLAALQEEPERAVRLVGAATALREVTGSSLSPAEQDLLEKMLDPARQSLGETAAASAEAAGRAMSLEQAISYALQAD